LGYGDCVKACTFDAIHIDALTGLPLISDEKCTSCGACVRACPRNLIELRKKAKKDRKIYVACSNCDKGGPARKACRVACIGCGRCQKVCSFDAISIVNNLAYIDAAKCTFCRKCVGECPTNAIIEINFPPAKPKAKSEAEAVQA
jgi:ferredoxin